MDKLFDEKAAIICALAPCVRTAYDERGLQIG